MKTGTVEVVRNAAESSGNLLRRFTKRVQSSGILPHARGSRYHTRIKTKFKRKKEALKLLKRREKYQELLKLGKISDVKIKKRR
ncbi:MAG: hypothetical protein AAB545_03530 [Patescibacteria group bacterium]